MLVREHRPVQIPVQSLANGPSKPFNGAETGSGARWPDPPPPRPGLVVGGREKIYQWSDDDFAPWPEQGELEPGRGVIVGMAQLLADADGLLAANRPLGVRLEAGEAVEDLAPHLDRVALVALAFPKFGDGRAYSAAALLRERYGFTGELRAVGEVLREQAWAMARVGFDSFEPADGSTPEDWTRAVGRYRHVYQRAEDTRAPVFEERADGPA